MLVSASFVTTHSTETHRMSHNFFPSAGWVEGKAALMPMLKKPTKEIIKKVWNPSKKFPILASSLLVLIIMRVTAGQPPSPTEEHTEWCAMVFEFGAGSMQQNREKVRRTCFETHNPISFQRNQPTKLPPISFSHGKNLSQREKILLFF